ncbi:MAG TPA: hypothetical protein VMM60_06485 [Ilumatobacter sp.]|nr:hypothetical protein [Ilumatobacter sp.]
MLRSGAQSSLRRLVGHGFAVASAVLCAYAIVVTTAEALNTNSTFIAWWLLGAVLLSLIAVVAIAVYVTQRAHPGGYFLVALVCILATFVCVAALIPVVAW